MATTAPEATTKGAPEYVSYGESSRMSEGREGSRIAFHQQGSGPTILMLHGFPTWSFDWYAVVSKLQEKRQIITPDFLGFGFSDKPVKEYTIGEQVDLIERLLKQLSIVSISIVAHDYGTIVAQEILVRSQKGELAFQVENVALLNGGIIFEAYRPTALQVALRLPIVGSLVSMLISEERVKAGLLKIIGNDHTLFLADWPALWYGISQKRGQYLAQRLLAYNEERKRNHTVWEDALAAFDGPMQLIWGLHDPVSGAAVLEAARPRLPRAEVVELQGIGHYPQVESPDAVAAALDRFLPHE